MEAKVHVEKRCLCGEYLKTGWITKAESEELGRKWNGAHTGPGHRMLSESAFKKMFPDKIA